MRKEEGRDGEGNPGKSYELRKERAKADKDVLKSTERWLKTIKKPETGPKNKKSTQSVRIHFKRFLLISGALKTKHFHVG